MARVGGRAVIHKFFSDCLKVRAALAFLGVASFKMATQIFGHTERTADEPDSVFQFMKESRTET